MAAPTKLFLEWNDIDGQYHVNDKDGYAFGAGSYEPTDSIKSARSVSDAPISFGESHAGFDRVCVPEKPDHAEEDHDEFIAMLSELAGMKVTQYYDDNMHFLGYGMDLDEDDGFLEAEQLAEAHENELVNLMGSYMEDE